jgi:hypothetical protein
MLITKVRTDDLMPLFDKKQEVDRTSIVNFIKDKVSLGSATYLINSLINQNLIKRTGYGKYTLNEKRRHYQPEIREKEKEIYQLLTTKKPLLNHCIWRTSIVNEFTLHQAGIFSIFVETEKIGIETVFDLLRDHYDNVYIQPSDEVFDRYTSYQNDAIIVLPIVSEAPIIYIEGIRTISIEKLLVDLVRETKLLEAFQGAELSYIYREVFSKYLINQPKMLRYASRRGIKQEVEHRINQILTYV